MRRPKFCISTNARIVKQNPLKNTTKSRLFPVENRCFFPWLLAANQHKPGARFSGHFQRNSPTLNPRKKANDQAPCVKKIRKRIGSDSSPDGRVPSQNGQMGSPAGNTRAAHRKWKQRARNKSNAPETGAARRKWKQRARNGSSAPETGATESQRAIRHGQGHFPCAVRKFPTATRCHLDFHAQAKAISYQE
jgi:hypothetical protein